ncbi:MinD/ParA family ATP-binding protein [Cryobacterium psychrophilum]|uniref:ATPase n=1 Tax=Cryobacterium psychrophilum TaxID=41988 RepID=A0A4Y8KN55_9MICO|nr:ATPase [Cryobacterium psychrophilum]TDW26992.1 MinD-like ATPase involved in chromosome partitioning or flagellar assembly [Cryobacterium psychrophilum]TFD75301.1 ATPase [Cryobacterium psychrophilum]
MIDTVPAFPKIEATVAADATGTVVINGLVQSVTGDDEQGVRTEVLAIVRATATEMGRPVRLSTQDSRGEQLLAVYPDGQIEILSDLTAASVHPTPAATVTDVPAPAFVGVVPAQSGAVEPLTRREVRASFLAPDAGPLAATTGWRGFLAKVGIQVAASAEELAERADVQAVSQHWPGPRTIAIVNGKGGANKTPTTAMLSAIFARNGGAGVLAWDNNETRGTLGWRTEQGPHDAVAQTLLPRTEHLLSPGAQSSDLARYVHHQTGDKYDVLRSNPTVLAAAQRLTTADFDALHSVAAKYFRLIFIDSGNDESAERWLRMIDHTDQLVIATTALGEHAEAGALLLEALAQRDERSAALAQGAVVIVSQSEKTGSLAAAQQIADGFGPLARSAVSIPFDAAMHGGKLRHDALAPATRRAWLAAAAAVAQGL